MAALFHSKFCSICGKQASTFSRTQLMDGILCSSCKSELSPFCKKPKGMPIDSIRHQLNERIESAQNRSKFTPTRTFGENQKILIDEVNDWFVFLEDAKCRIDNADIIDFTRIIHCEFIIKEDSKEIEYKDSNGKIRSYNPRAFAFSYNIFVKITTNIPYIGTITYKVNGSPLDNNQETLICPTHHSLKDIWNDNVNNRRVYPGEVSNAATVRASFKFQQCEKEAQEITAIFSELQKEHIKEQKRRRHYIVCPWCDSKIPNTSRFCENCGGTLGNC